MHRSTPKTKLEASCQFVRSLLARNRDLQAEEGRVSVCQVRSACLVDQLAAAGTIAPAVAAALYVRKVNRIARDGSLFNDIARHEAMYHGQQHGVQMTKTTVTKTLGELASTGQLLLALPADLRAGLLKVAQSAEAREALLARIARDTTVPGDPDAAAATREFAALARTWGVPDEGEGDAEDDDEAEADHDDEDEGVDEAEAGAEDEDKDEDEDEDEADDDDEDEAPEAPSDRSTQPRAPAASGAGADTVAPAASHGSPRIGQKRGRDSESGASTAVSTPAPPVHGEEQDGRITTGAVEEQGGGAEPAGEEIRSAFAESGRTSVRRRIQAEAQDW